jgi:hypothetical protein
MAVVPHIQIRMRDSLIGLMVVSPIGSDLVPIQKWPICPISALREKFNPRNINYMPVVKFFFAP